MDPQALARNLADAGCPPPLAEELLALLAAGREEEALARLARHRAALLERCHTAERAIGCLDYLVYRLERPAQTHKEVFP